LNQPVVRPIIKIPGRVKTIGQLLIQSRNAHLSRHQPILPQTTEPGKSKTGQIYGLTPLMTPLTGAPAIGQPVIGIVSVFENGCAGGINGKSVNSED
jgi:hypothetical protein